MIVDQDRASPSVKDVRDAAEQIRAVAVRTPVITSPVLDAATGARVLIKAENLQRTGSFKFRGAYNRLSRLSDDDRARGVVACSSGNHAQGVAEAARLLRTPATIVMPTDAPAGKVRGVRERGATVVTYDRLSEDRFAVMADIAKSTGAVETPPYDHPHIIAGQGTAGLEFAAQSDAAGARLDALFCNVGGGGLMAGLALAFEAESPRTKLYAVEPAGFDDTRRSLLSGVRKRNAAAGGSICDALLPEAPGEMTFGINKPRLAGGVVVTDAEALAAMNFAFRRLKLVLEPGGAASLAAVLFGKIDVRGKTIGVVVTGGNVDADMFERAIGV